MELADIVTLKATLPPTTPVKVWLDDRSSAECTLAELEPHLGKKALFIDGVPIMVQNLEHIDVGQDEINDSQ